jgi:hypothetical protein
VHLAVLLGLNFSLLSVRVLFGVNAVVALAVLAYAGTRWRILFASRDWPYLTLVAVELVILMAAVWTQAHGKSPTARIISFTAFGLHSCICLGAAIFSFAFRMTRLM